jgi:chromosome segregation ATPase
MIRTSEMREKKTYTIRNEDTAPRTLIVEHPVQPGWNLTSDTLKPEETTGNSYRFRVALGAKQSSTLEISESHPVETRIELSNLTDDQIGLMLKENSISPEIEQALREIQEQKAQVESFTTEADNRDTETSSIYDDQQRLRENLKALKGSAEEKALTQRYTHQLTDQETRLEKLRVEKEDFGKKAAAAQAQLDKMIEELAMEATLGPR